MGRTSTRSHRRTARTHMWTARPRFPVSLRIDGQQPPPGGGQGVGTGGGGTTGKGSTGSGSTGSGSTGSGSTGSGSTGSGSTGSGSTGSGSTGASGKGSKGSGSKGTGPAGESALQKYLHNVKKGSAGGGVAGQSSLLRAANLRAAATSALGFASPIVRILAWCVVLAVAIYLPAVAVGEAQEEGAGRDGPGLGEEPLSRRRSSPPAVSVHRSQLVVPDQPEMELEHRPARHEQPSQDASSLRRPSSDKGSSMMWKKRGKHSKRYGHRSSPERRSATSAATASPAVIKRRRWMRLGPVAVGGVPVLGDAVFNTGR